MNETSVVTAFLDASVLYPALLRNILIRLALHGLFRARWSARVQDEWINALSRSRTDLSRERIERTRSLMETHLQDASVTGFEDRIAALTLPDADDRHVLAAAIQGEATLIVTTNLRDFPASALADFGIEALHPDTFILSLLESDQGNAVAALRRLHSSLKNPPVTVIELLAMIKHQGLTATAEALDDVL